jgi:phosphomannomutase
LNNHVTKEMPVSDPIISVSGLRGIVGEGLTPEVAMRYVAAFAAECTPGPLVVTRDGRFSGEMLAKAVHAGLQAVGRDTIDAGIAPTPTLGILVRHCRAAGGVQISASHNPPEYNGLKLFSSEGRVIPAGPGQRVLARYSSPAAPWVRQDRLGRSDSLRDPLTPHLEAVLATVDVERIRTKAFRVLLDSNHGAGSELGRRLLEALGCQVAVLGGEPDGRFAHPPEPTAENLAGVLPEVVQAGADVGFCQDPDADRLAVIDESGRYLGEEYTLALCVDHVLRRRRGPVVANCATSRMSQDLAEQYGVPFFRSAVGEANVVDAMLAHDALFGGEGNGGPIDPRVGLVRDSFVGMAQLLDAMAAREAKISQLAGELPRYHIVKTKIDLDAGRVPAALAELEAQFADAKADRLDGLRLDWPGRWLLVRPSNTEPIVRAIAEAATSAEAAALCQRAAEILGRVR